MSGWDMNWCNYKCFTNLKNMFNEDHCCCCCFKHNCKHVMSETTPDRPVWLQDLGTSQTHHSAENPALGFCAYTHLSKTVAQSQSLHKQNAESTGEWSISFSNAMMPDSGNVAISSCMHISNWKAHACKNVNNRLKFALNYFHWYSLEVAWYCNVFRYTM